MKKQMILLSLAIAIAAHSGVTNPDLSVIGQVQSNWTNDQAESNNLPNLQLGEVEVVLQSALNPYADGQFVFAVGEEGLEVEEGYIDLNRALPLGLALKAGKFRAPFGKINRVHPHAYPFIEAPNLLNPESGLIPGEESYNDVAFELSQLLPGIGSWAPQISFSVQQGSLFRIGQDQLDTASDFDPELTETHYSYLIHSANGFQWGDNHVGEFGVSMAFGTNHVSANTHTFLYGTDFKFKLFLPNQSKLIFQGEGIFKQQETPIWSPTTESYSTSTENLYGFVGILDYKWKRWNVGSLYEQMADANTNTGLDQSIRGFAGFSLFEETTLFRVSVEQRWIENEDPFSRIGMQILYSMGPHKPHQF